MLPEDVDNCQKYPLQVLNNQEGHLPSAAVPADCPVRISAKRGQTIRLYLYDFSTPTSATDDAPAPSTSAIDDVKPATGCQPLYGEIVEKFSSAQTFCRHEQRLSMLYTSTGHVIDVVLYDVSSYGSRFLLKYTGTAIQKSSCTQCTLIGTM